jgi:hypothetical protein
MSNPNLIIPRLRSGAARRQWPEGLLIEAAERIAELEAENAQLRKAISGHKLKLNATAAIPTSIDRELWAALEIVDE